MVKLKEMANTQYVHIPASASRRNYCRSRTEDWKIPLNTIRIHSPRWSLCPETLDRDFDTKGCFYNHPQTGPCTPITHHLPGVGWGRLRLSANHSGNLRASGAEGLGGHSGLWGPFARLQADRQNDGQAELRGQAGWASVQTMGSGDPGISLE